MVQFLELLKKQKKAHQIGAISCIYFLIFEIQALNRTTKRVSVCVYLYIVFMTCYMGMAENFNPMTFFFFEKQPSDLFVTFNITSNYCHVGNGIVHYGRSQRHAFTSTPEGNNAILV